MNHWTERVRGNGLMLNVHRFAPEEAAAGDRTVLMLHGFMDAGGTWSAVAEGLCERGLPVVAPDFRGFGRSDRVSAGGYYHFADYIADVEALVAELALGRLVVVGHSMGGTVACYFTATTRHAVDRLVLMEGLGPPDMGPALGPARMRRWLEQLQHPKKTSPLASVDAAVSRLAARHTVVPRETLQRVAEHLTVEQDGELRWAFDPLHRTTSPSLFRADAFGSFLAEISCPVLFIGGGDTGWHPEDEAQRLQMLRNPPQRVDMADAGHMMHWTRPVEVADAIATFVADEPGR